jgi:hypothetical protein
MRKSLETGVSDFCVGEKWIEPSSTQMPTQNFTFYVTFLDLTVLCHANMSADESFI